MIRVWSDGRSAGLLDRFGIRGSTFAYDQGAAPELAVSAGTTRCGLTPAQARDILDRIADGISRAAVELQAYQQEHLEFREVGNRMLRAWAHGIQEALGCEPRPCVTKIKPKPR